MGYRRVGILTQAFERAHKSRVNLSHWMLCYIYVWSLYYFDLMLTVSWFSSLGMRKYLISFGVTETKN